MAGPRWKRGADQAQEASEQISKGGVSGPRVHYFGLKNSGDQAILRFLTEATDWITVLQHMYVPPQRQLKSPPKSLSAVCRNDEQFEGMFGDCYIDANNLLNLYGKPAKATPRTWALACLREEIIADEAMIVESHEPGWKGEPLSPDMLGTIVGYRDAVREVAEIGPDKKPTGKTVQEKALVVVNMSYSNFFGSLHGSFMVYKTVLDRDYLVRRVGSGTDVEYHPIPMNPIENLKPGTEGWKKYEENLKAQKLDLEEIVMARASDEYYAHFFDITKDDPWAPKSEEGPAQKPQAAPLSQQVAEAPKVEQSALDAMRARLKANGGPTSATPTGVN